MADISRTYAPLGASDEKRVRCAGHDTECWVRKIVGGSPDEVMMRSHSDTISAVVEWNSFACAPSAH